MNCEIIFDTHKKKALFDKNTTTDIQYTQVNWLFGELSLTKASCLVFYFWLSQIQL